MIQFFITISATYSCLPGSGNGLMSIQFKLQIEDSDDVQKVTPYSSGEDGSPLSKENCPVLGSGSYQDPYLIEVSVNYSRPITKRNGGKCGVTEVSIVYIYSNTCISKSCLLVLFSFRNETKEGMNGSQRLPVEKFEIIITHRGLAGTERYPTDYNNMQCMSQPDPSFTIIFNEDFP